MGMGGQKGQKQYDILIEQPFIDIRQLIKGNELQGKVLKNVPFTQKITFFYMGGGGKYSLIHALSHGFNQTIWNPFSFPCKKNLSSWRRLPRYFPHPLTHEKVCQNTFFSNKTNKKHLKRAKHNKYNPYKKTFFSPLQ